MKWTNEFGLDPAISQAVMANPYTLVGDVSVTGLLRPAQIAKLERQNLGDMSEDVSDGLWRLLGRAIHNIVAEAKIEGSLQEYRLMACVMCDFAEINREDTILSLDLHRQRCPGWVVSGAFDRWYDTKVMVDYKVTSVWRYIYSGFSEWEEQLNLYRYLAHRNGIEVSALKVEAILRDWNANRASEDEDFPPRPFISIPLMVWPLPFAERFLKERVALHQAARAGLEVPECTDEERWAKPDTWAVQKSGAKRAWRVFNSTTKAREFWSTLKPGYEIVHRPGQQIRCERFCPVRQWCTQADRLNVPRKGDDE